MLISLLFQDKILYLLCSLANLLIIFWVSSVRPFGRNTWLEIVFFYLKLFSLWLWIMAPSAVTRTFKSFGTHI